MRRFHPIVRIALAAIRPMIALSRSAFLGSMAVAIMGGLNVATTLPRLSLPGLFAAWLKLRRAEAG